jgi:flagellar biosynthesis protein FlhB
MADSSKTEQATPRHRLKARERGQVTRSRELTGALSMFAVAGVLALMAREARATGRTFSATRSPLPRQTRSRANGPLLFWTSVKRCAGWCPSLAALAVSLGVGLCAGRLCLCAGALALKFERLNPVNRCNRCSRPPG